ncbi:MAG: SRPBCC domain-containing protein [Gaiellales bacterium]
MTQTANLQTMRHQAQIASPADRVYRALTAELERWFSDSADVDIAAGRFDFWGDHVFESPDRDAGRHHLLDHADGRSLRFEWRVRGADTEVAVELTPQAGGTAVEVTHSGVPERPSGKPSLDDVWRLALDNLRRWCEAGTAPDMVDFARNPVGQSRSSLEVEASREAVFDALIKPDQVSRWCGAHADIDPVVGGRYDFGWGIGGPVEILDLETPSRLAYSWAFSDEPESVVTWELEGSGGRTRITVIHSGFGDRPVGGYEAGWMSFLVKIRRQIEQGA